MDLDTFVASLKPFTKVMMIGIAATAGVMTLNVVSPAHVVMFFPDHALHLWKYLTTLLYNGGFNMALLFELIFFYSTCNGLEANFMANRYGDFLFMISFLYGVSFVGQAIVNYGGYLLLYQSFAFALTYVFCRKNPDQEFKVMFILKLKAIQFPWFYLFFRLMVGHSLLNLVIGLIAGHLYIYLKEVLPVTHRKQYLNTPLAL